MEIIFDLIPATGPVPLTVLIFAVLLILASQRIEDIMGWDLDTDTTKASFPISSLVFYLDYCESREKAI